MGSRDGSFCKAEEAKFMQKAELCEEYKQRYESILNEYSAYKKDVCSKLEELDIIKQQLQNATTQLQLEQDKNSVYKIQQDELPNILKLKAEVETLKLENERLRPKCGEILILQERLESMKEQNKRLETRMEGLRKRKDFENENDELIGCKATTKETLERLTALMNQTKTENTLLKQQLNTLNKNVEENGGRSQKNMNESVIKYKSKFKKYKLKWTQTNTHFENFKKCNISYKEILDKFVEHNINDKLLYNTLQKNFKEKVDALIAECNELKTKSLEISRTQSLQAKSPISVDSFKNKSNEASEIVMSPSNSPFINDYKDLLEKLKKSYVHNKTLINAIKTLKKSQPTNDNLDQIIAKLPTSKMYHDVNEKYLQTEKLLNRIKMVSNQRINQIRLDVKNLLGFSVEIDPKDRNRITLTSVSASNGANKLTFDTDDNHSVYELNEKASSLNLKDVNNIDTYIKSSDMADKPWPVILSHIVIELDKIK